MDCKAIGTQAKDQPLQVMTIKRRDVGAADVAIDILYCGICHSDLHTARSEWGPSNYPVVPGHEIVGKVSAVGADVTKFNVGDIVGVGCLVDSCQKCSECKEGLEQFCDGFTLTYNSKVDGQPEPGHTLGGYSGKIVVSDKFVLKVTHPEDKLAAVAPLLCAGVTTWSPLRTWGAGPGKKVGIVGIGGLGHMGIKLAHALGAHTVAFTSSEGKRQNARDLGADDVILSTNQEEMAKHMGTFDLIIDSVSASHNLDAFTMLLKRDGTLVLVGAPEHPHPSPMVFPLIFKRRRIAGSLIGGIAETQEMLDFCAEKGITSDIELIKASEVNTAYERILRSDVKYRFVIDIAGSL